MVNKVDRDRGFGLEDQAIDDLPPLEAGNIDDEVMQLFEDILNVECGHPINEENNH